MYDAQIAPDREVVGLPSKMRVAREGSRHAQDTHTPRSRRAHPLNSNWRPAQAAGAKLDCAISGDRLYGEAGNHSLNGGSGTGDYCSGSSGIDTAAACETTLGIP